MTLSTTDFGSFHAAVHGGKQPFAWQQRLLDQIVQSRAWPRVLDLPTGSGKTTCLDIALFALALDAGNDAEQRWCPRRIAMVVDRRVVVDQVAERGREILRALVTSSDSVVVEVAARLRGLTRAGEDPLGVFTLRGGMPKDDGWARTPDQALIIASTVDQVGSRMFMQGYGVSPGMKPVHAGLLANDTLLLLDEVHLSEPFRQTLEQVARLRTRFAGRRLATRFAHVFLSATPGAGTDAPFTLLAEETAPDSPLGPRLHASKPTRLVEVEDRTALEKECVDQAKDLLEKHRTIAIVVNRLASASAIANALEDLRTANVTLLTGRMRPLDRDDVLADLRPAVQAGRIRNDDSPRRVVVGTQCIEAGADFDFDALVTEAASLDSLRQRFGRVDRLGAYGRADGVVVFDKSAKDDPVYGDTIAETVKWFKGQVKERPKKIASELKRLTDAAKTLRGEARQLADAQIARTKLVDFGVLGLTLPTGEDLGKLLAPKKSAPTLLPAYLDLWAQTYPEPAQVPDVSLWLHGPSAGPADVQVIWRADLNEQLLHEGQLEAAVAIVASIRPSSLESISLPFATARAWLANRQVVDLGDTEAVAQRGDDPLPAGRPALRWNGDRSAIVNGGSDDENLLRPGDTIVVPSTYGGIRRGCFDADSSEPVRDRAEQAELFSRARPALRLHPIVLDQLGLSLPLDDAREARVALSRLSSREDWPRWKGLWAERLSASRNSIVVKGDPSWLVLEGGRLSPSDLRKVLRPDDTVENGVELTTDGDDSFHAGRSVSLEEHSSDVEAFAHEYATRCGLGPWLAAHVAMAAWLHDVGKADRRFQLMLRGGSEIDLFKDETPWAKSQMLPGAREAHRRAQQGSGYPRGARHEVQSLAMLEGQRAMVAALLRKAAPAREPDLDLVLHLVASHHGYCRPFAPAILDPQPVDVTLAGHASARFGDIDFAPTSSANAMHRLDAPLADRFWRLVARYGWQELCWLEAILRLADHRASEEEQGKP